MLRPFPLIIKHCNEMKSEINKLFKLLQKFKVYECLLKMTQFFRAWHFIFAKYIYLSCYFWPLKWICFCIECFLLTCKRIRWTISNFAHRYSRSSSHLSSILDCKKIYWKDHLPVKVGLKSRPMYFERRKRWAITRFDWLHWTTPV